MQSLWLLTKEWDQELPLQQVEFWRECYTSLSALSNLQIPRWIELFSICQPCEFHCFADASKAAYAGVVYLLILSDTPVVFLLGSKTKVTLIKILSIPRLELCAVQLAAKLTRHLIDHLGLLSAKVHLWSDSKDVL